VSFLAARFDVSAADAEAWSDALLEAGALSVDVSDPFAGTERETPMFGEPGEPPSTMWQMSRVVVLVAGDADVHHLLRDVAAATRLALPAYEVHPIADEDWVRRTQSQFGPIEIAPDFFIVPTWSDPPRADALVLRLDPGLAFGTGSHPTTRLCLRWLRDHLRGDESVLDYGCGSGILAIAAAKLGAARVVGVDVDPQAMRASTSNATMNSVDARFVMPDEIRLRPSARMVSARPRRPFGGGAHHRALRPQRRGGVADRPKARAVLVQQQQQIELLDAGDVPHDPLPRGVVERAWDPLASGH